MSEPPSVREILHVLVPCLNEEASIEPTVREILSVAEGIPIEIKIELIDDGSSDATGSVMEGVAAVNSCCTVHRNPRNLGLGLSIRRVLEGLPPNDWATVLPGDGEFVFSSIRNFIEVRSQYDLLLGFLNNPVIRTLGRRLASHTFTKLVATLYGFRWRYLNGMKMYRVWVFQGLEIQSAGHAWMAEAIAKAQLRRPELPNR